MRLPRQRRRAALRRRRRWAQGGNREEIEGGHRSPPTGRISGGQATFGASAVKVPRFRQNPASAGCDASPFASTAPQAPRSAQRLQTDRRSSPLRRGRASTPPAATPKTSPIAATRCGDMRRHAGKGCGPGRGSSPDRQVPASVSALDFAERSASGDQGLDTVEHERASWHRNCRPRMHGFARSDLIWRKWRAARQVYSAACWAGSTSPTISIMIRFSSKSLGV